MWPHADLNLTKRLPLARIIINIIIENKILIYIHNMVIDYGSLLFSAKTTAKYM